MFPAVALLLPAVALLLALLFLAVALLFLAVALLFCNNRAWRFASSSHENLPKPSHPTLTPYRYKLMKDRYKLMKAYMPTVGSMGLDMMFRTCTVQVGV
jgi:hypothetical protein